MLNIWGVNPVAATDDPDGLISNRRSHDKSLQRKHRQANSLLRSPGYLPISSIPDCSAPGLNYTFVSGSLCKRSKEQILPEQANPEQLSSRPKRKYIRSPFHRTPEGLKNSAEEIVLTIDTRLDTNNDQADKDQNKSIDRPSFLNDHSFVKHSSLSRGMMETHDGEESDSEDEEYVKESTPGPGAYNPYNSLLDKKTHSLFISKGQRFQTIRKSPEPVEQQEQKHISKRKPIKLRDRLRPAQYRKCYPFESSLPRVIEDKPEHVPGPGYYRPRQSIEQELIKKIQRDFKGKFGRQEERFRVEKNLSEQLGPGYYTIDNNGTDPPAQSSYFRSNIKRQLFNKPAKVPGVGTYQTDPAPVKLYEDPEVDNPFGSKSKRFSDDPSIQRIGKYTDSLDALGSHSLYQLYKKRQQDFTRRMAVLPQTSKYYSPKYEQTPGPGYYASEF